MIVLSDALECVNGAWIYSQEKGVERQKTDTGYTAVYIV